MARSRSANARLSPVAATVSGDGRGRVAVPGMDAYAIANGHWYFDTDMITGIYLPGNIPLDELLFFLVIPLASILTLEAVRSVKGWPVGDGSDR